jgi:hypothetical protein
MNIDDIINEFYKLHDYKGKFRFNTPEYVSFHRSLTDFIYENHLEDTMYWIYEHICWRNDRHKKPQGTRKSDHIEGHGYKAIDFC